MWCGGADGRCRLENQSTDIIKQKPLDSGHFYLLLDKLGSFCIHEALHTLQLKGPLRKRGLCMWWLLTATPWTLGGEGQPSHSQSRNSVRPDLLPCGSEARVGKRSSRSLPVRGQQNDTLRLSVEVGFFNFAEQLDSVI